MGRVPTIYYCSYENCTASFNRKHRYETHLRSHTGERPFFCSHGECGKNFASVSHLQRHEATHTSSFRCTEENCVAVLKSKATLKKHIKLVHLKLKNQKLYTCTQCGKVFNKHNTFQRHELRHSGQLPYKCSVEDCPKAFLTPSKLQRHMKVHEGYPCKVSGCDKVLEKWTLYVQHVKECHPPKHQCQVCSKEFATFHNLKLHIPLHEEPRLVYPCEVPNCTRYYYAERNLKWHVRKYHEKRPFKCKKENCHKAFKTEADLTDHILYHDKKKPRKKKKSKKRKPSLAAILSGYSEVEHAVNEENAEPVVVTSSSEVNISDLEPDTTEISFTYCSEPGQSTIMEEDNLNLLTNKKNVSCTKSFEALSVQNVSETSQSNTSKDTNTFNSNGNDNSIIESKREMHQTTTDKEIASVVVSSKNHIVPMDHETNNSLTELEASESAAQKYTTIEVVESENLPTQNLIESSQSNPSRYMDIVSSNINGGSSVESELEMNQSTTAQESNSVGFHANNNIVPMEHETRNSLTELEAPESVVQQYTTVEVIDSENSQLIYVPVIKIDDKSWNSNVIHIKTVS